MITTYFSNYLSSKILLKLKVFFEIKNLTQNELSIDLVKNNKYIIISDSSYGYYLVYICKNKLQFRHFILSDDDKGSYLLNGSGHKYRDLFEFVLNSLDV